MLNLLLLLLQLTPRISPIEIFFAEILGCKVFPEILILGFVATFWGCQVLPLVQWWLT